MQALKKLSESCDPFGQLFRDHLYSMKLDELWALVGKLPMRDPSGVGCLFSTPKVPFGCVFLTKKLVV